MNKWDKEGLQHSVENIIPTAPSSWVGGGTDDISDASHEEEDDDEEDDDDVYDITCSGVSWKTVDCTSLPREASVKLMAARASTSSTLPPPSAGPITAPPEHPIICLMFGNRFWRAGNSVVALNDAVSYTLETKNIAVSKAGNEEKEEEEDVIILFMISSMAWSKSGFCDIADIHDVVVVFDDVDDVDDNDEADVDANVKNLYLFGVLEESTNRYDWWTNEWCLKGLIDLVVKAWGLNEWQHNVYSAAICANTSANLDNI